MAGSASEYLQNAFNVKVQSFAHHLNNYRYKRLKPNSGAPGIYVSWETIKGLIGSLGLRLAELINQDVGGVAESRRFLVGFSEIPAT
jgi:hypothetical protein